MVLWSDSTTGLKDALAACDEFLTAELELKLKPTPYINHTRHGMDFLGCRVYRSHLVLNRRSRGRFRQKLAALEAAYESAQIDERELMQRATALTSFAKTPAVSSWRWRRGVLERISVSGRKARTG